MTTCLPKTETNFDWRLHFFYQFAAIEEEEKERLSTQYGVSSFDQLRGKKDDLKKASKLRMIDARRQRKLWASLEWYADYHRVYQKEPNLKDELTDHTLVVFEGNDYSIPYPEGESLKHVFKVLRNNSNDLQHSFADCGIRTFDDVIKYRKELGNGNFGQGVPLGGEAAIVSIPKKIQKDLAQVVEWFDDFIERNNQRTPNLQKDFTEEAFDNFVEKNAYKYTFDAMGQYRMTKMEIHNNEPPAFLKSIKDDEREYKLKKTIEAAKEDVVKNHLSERLRSLAPDVLDRLLDYWLGKLMNFDEEDTFRKPMVIHGDMQSGKSAVTAVGLAVCRALGVPCVVATKGRTECLELIVKLKDFAPAGSKDLVYKCPRKRSPRAEIMRILEKGGTFVVFDSKAQFENLHACLKEYWSGKKFAAQIDEGMSISVLVGLKG